MSKKIVFDASALVALIKREPGNEEVEKHLPHSVMSTVNLAEVFCCIKDLDISHDEIATWITEIIPFDQKQASVVASLVKDTKPYGLSLGDRACLALAKINNLPVLSADKSWAKTNIGVHIQLLR